jgi:uncharacterized lipoprotein YddW (UPF0748 family)
MWCEVDKNNPLWGVVIAVMTTLALLVGCGEVGGQPNPETASEGADQAGSHPVELANSQSKPQEPAVQTRNESNLEVASTGDSAALPPARDTSQMTRETRAIWSWAGRKEMPGRDAITKRDIDELVAEVDAAHLNVILLSVHNEGTAFFEPSHTRFPDSSDRLPNESAFSEDGYHDALSYLLAIRDKRRLDDNPGNDFEVHAWFGVTRSGDYEDNQGWPRPDKTKRYMLHYLHPEFKLKYGCYYQRENEACVNHKYSSVHQPRFRAYLTDLIAGLAEDYDIDGVHLDYIRAMEICYNGESLDYPGTGYDYPGCQEDYKAWTQATYGHEYTLWEDTDGNGNIQDGGSGRVAAWQESAINALVKSIHDEVKKARPNIVISAAVGLTSPEDRKTSVQGQAAWEWLDQGWIDAAFVMAYYADTQAVVDKVQTFRAAVQDVNHRSRVFPGLATFTIDDPNDYWTYLVTEQINAVMHGQWTGQALAPPARGMALFLDRRLSEQAVKALAKGPFKEPALPFWGE